MITEAVNIPKSKGLVDKALVVDNCSRSLCPVGTVCESKNLGFEIDAGANGSRFLSGGETFPELDKEGDFFVFEVDTDSGYESCIVRVMIASLMQLLVSVLRSGVVVIALNSMNRFCLQLVSLCSLLLWLSLALSNTEWMTTE